MFHQRKPYLEADTYIIQLSGVGGLWVDNPQRVTEGAIFALTPSEGRDIPSVLPKFGKIPPFYSVSYQVVSDWETYKKIIETCDNVIIVNAHGGVLSVSFRMLHYLGSLSLLKLRLL